MTQDELAAIKRRAEAATPGEWFIYSEPEVNYPPTVHCRDYGDGHFPVWDDPANIDFIATCNPTTILALLDALSAAEARYQEEYKIVDRCWKALGITTYEGANGKAIQEIITEQRGRMEAAETKVRELEAALRLIEQMGDKTLIASSLGECCDRAHQIGANKAFGQMADIAAAAMQKEKEG